MTVTHSQGLTKAPAAYEAATLCEAFQQRIAGGLARQGVSRGDAVAMMLTNRPEFHLLDMALLHLGATPFSIYNTSAPEQILYLFENAETRLVLTGTRC